jgi:hypothetical protein
MKISIKIMMALLILLVHFSTSDAQPIDFSGTWKRNDNKTKLADGLSTNSVPISMLIKQDVNSIKIERTNKNGNGMITSYSVVLKFDGSSTDIITPSKLRRSSTSQWSADHRYLLEKAVSRDDQGNVKQTYKYTYMLEDGGKSLKITASLDAGEQTYELTEVFDKQ